VELLEVIDGGDNGVVVAAQMTGQIKGTDSPVSINFGEVFTLRGGRIVAIRDHTTLEQALEAVGLRE
jgi:ketosteroid isomerase-like protein